MKLTAAIVIAASNFATARLIAYLKDNYNINLPLEISVVALCIIISVAIMIFVIELTTK